MNPENDPVIWKLTYTDCVHRKHEKREWFYSDFARAKERQRHLEACNARSEETGGKAWYRGIDLRPVVVL